MVAAFGNDGDVVFQALGASIGDARCALPAERIGPSEILAFCFDPEQREISANLLAALGFGHDAP
jgi:hypothetical protein